MSRLGRSPDHRCRSCCRSLAGACCCCSTSGASALKAADQPGLDAACSLRRGRAAAVAADASASGDVYLLGNWPAPFGIVLVLDRLSALMLLLTAVLGARFAGLLARALAPGRRRISIRCSSSC